MSKTTIVEYNFDHFNLICLKDFTDSDGRRKGDKLAQRDDMVVANSKEFFISELRNAPIEKVQYLNYWKEHTRPEIIKIYDEIIDSREEIEELINDSDEDFFIIRKKSNG